MTSLRFLTIVAVLASGLVSVGCAQEPLGEEETSGAAVSEATEVCHMGDMFKSVDVFRSSDGKSVVARYETVPKPTSFGPFPLSDTREMVFTTQRVESALRLLRERSALFDALTGRSDISYAQWASTARCGADDDGATKPRPSIEPACRLGSTPNPLGKGSDLSFTQSSEEVVQVRYETFSELPPEGGVRIALSTSRRLDIQWVSSVTRARALLIGARSLADELLGVHGRNIGEIDGALVCR